MVAFVSSEGYFEVPSWLKVGFDLSKNRFSTVRCVFPLPTGDLQGAVDVPGD